MMTYRGYIKEMLPEAIPLFLMAVTVVVCLAEGFYIPDEMLGMVRPVLLPCALTIAGFIAGFYSKKTVWITIIICVALVVAGIVYMQSGTDSKNAFILFLAVAIAASGVIFLLTRSRIGCCVCIAGGTLIISGNAFVGYGSHRWCLILFLVFSGIELIVRSYRIRTRISSTRQTAVKRQMLSGTVYCLLAAVCAFVLCVAVIEPLDLPSQDLKLTTQLMHLPLSKRIGISSTVPIKDPDQTTSLTNDELINSDKEGEDPTNGTQQPDSDENNGIQKENPAGAVAKNPVRLPKRAAKAVTYLKKDYHLLILIVLLVIAVLAVFTGKQLLRRSRQKKIRSLAGREQVVACFQYFLRIMGMAGFPCAKKDSPREYAEKIKLVSPQFFGSSEQFAQLCDGFDRSYYGVTLPTAEECAQYMKHYCALPKKLRRYTGLIKYLRYYFRT